MNCDDKEITGVILCGGQGRRMGLCDKGLMELAGKPAVEHVLAAISGQVSRIMINANQNTRRYESYGFPVHKDTLGNFQGPLAGMVTALKYCETPLLATFPCDCPAPPADLIARQCLKLTETKADLVTVREGERLHPVFCLMHKRLLGSLEAFLRSGRRKIDQWFREIKVAEAVYEKGDPRFANINDPDSLKAVTRFLLT